ncbi:penicillin acylase family protein [Alteromonas gilva]|uniref:Penicillin acylase family protein n=1 Tax=Alteromonas gilva TaxID=2987522 RepID=A0ABT5L6E4_9ALTE|nr:penicillin acylase family protein [Alteromonas gilva]MDC8831412.1 penicillin acylase family protein [Alteromonas gilva]
MLNWFKRISLIVLSLVIIAVMAVYLTLRQSLPALDGERTVSQVSQPATLSRDSLGQAIIHASTRKDAMYLLGYAHGQDRFFQMDLQRRAAAGELAEWLGDMAAEYDKANRFHQFRRRAEHIVTAMPAQQRALLVAYSDGVNEALNEMGARPFEYIVTNFEPAPWTPADSVLVIFSMYLDLQGSSMKRDLALTSIAHVFGQPMVDFLTQSSQYQAALDGSLVTEQADIPALPGATASADSAPAYTSAILDAAANFVADIGSNNWVVDGTLTDTGDALLASDMHLGMRVPTTWYRAQLNYPGPASEVSVTGVSLPGVPGIVAGTNGHIAWGFTNSYIDTADWIQVDKQDVTSVKETLNVGGDIQSYNRLVSEYGPVKQVGTRFYALSWVAHQPYAVNMLLVELANARSVAEALPVVSKLGIPVQNIAIGDTDGNIAWMLAGAVPARETPHDMAITPEQFDAGWQTDETELPVVMNPDTHRIWSANSRVMSSTALSRFGDGGYALGARASQVRDRLFEHEQFDEARFYAIQLDNEARFLQPWHSLLRALLSQNADSYQADIAALDNWGKCACSDSVGYTLVKHFRGQLLTTVFAPVNNALNNYGQSLWSATNALEPAIWQLINAQSASWLPAGQNNWQDFMRAEYDSAKSRLLSQHSETGELADLAWGKVNVMALTHPFAGQIPVLGSALNMPRIPGFGDTFMPAVQGRDFGASQRLFVRPGQLDKAVLTVPGGQSGHPLSAFYQAGFSDYANQRNTPLMPSAPLHTLTFIPE